VKTRVLVSVGGALLVVALALSTVSGAFAQARPTPVPGGRMGPGGMMTPGGLGPGGMMSFGNGAQATPLESLDAAEQAFQRYIDATGNTDFALDEVMQFQWNYYAVIKDKSTPEWGIRAVGGPANGSGVSRNGSQHDVEHQIQPDELLRRRNDGRHGWLRTWRDDERHLGPNRTCDTAISDCRPVAAIRPAVAGPISTRQHDRDTGCIPRLLHRAHHQGWAGHGHAVVGQRLHWPGLVPHVARRVRCQQRSLNTSRVLT
jgi:hypothetical protein